LDCPNLQRQLAPEEVSAQVLRRSEEKTHSGSWMVMNKWGFQPGVLKMMVIMGISWSKNGESPSHQGFQYYNILQ
jgi:hypothetical protein